MEKLDEKIKRQMSITSDWLKNEENGAMRDYYLGKLVAYTEMRGLIETTKGEESAIQ